MTQLLIVDLERFSTGIIGTRFRYQVFSDVKVARLSGVCKVRFTPGEQQLHLPGLHTGDL